MRNCLGLMWMVGSVVACGPQPSDSATASETAPTTTSETTGTTAETTDTGTSTSAAPTTGAPTSSTAASTTGPPFDCEDPGQNALPALLLSGSVLVIQPGLFQCGELNPNSCDCLDEEIDRLVVELPEPLTPGMYQFAADDPALTHTACAMGDDGCAQANPGGLVRIFSVSPNCVLGEVDVASDFEGTFAVAPC